MGMAHHRAVKLKDRIMTDNGKGEYGEGNYKAAREFDEAEAAFAKDKDKVKKAALDAERALDGDEAAELKKAEEAGKAHAKR